MPKHQQEARHCASGGCRTLVSASRNSKVSQQRAANFPQQTPAPPHTAADNQQTTDWRACRGKMPSVLRCRLRPCQRLQFRYRNSSAGVGRTGLRKPCKWQHTCSLCGVRCSLGHTEAQSGQSGSHGPSSESLALILTDGAIHRTTNPARTRIQQSARAVESGASSPPPRLPLQFSLLSFHLHHSVQCHPSGPLPL